MADVLTFPQPRAYGGGPLVGNRLMWLIYVDESGTSPREPISVVAGVAIQPDDQWLKLEAEISNLRNLVPAVYRKKFIFHATDLWSTKSRVYEEAKWPRAERVELLRKLIALPRAFSLPIIYAHARKPDVNDPPQQRAVLTHGIAYMLALIAGDRLIKEIGEPNEIALIVAEDNPHARRVIKGSHHILSDPHRSKEVPLPASMLADLPISKIKDTVHFASKSQAPLLQIADACAFVLRRHVTGAPENRRLLVDLFGDLMPLADGVLFEIADHEATSQKFNWFRNWPGNYKAWTDDPDEMASHYYALRIEES